MCSSRQVTLGTSLGMPASARPSGGCGRPPPARRPAAGRRTPPASPVPPPRGRFEPPAGPLLAADGRVHYLSVKFRLAVFGPVRGFGGVLPRSFGFDHHVRPSATASGPGPCSTKSAARGAVPVPLRTPPGQARSRRRDANSPSSTRVKFGICERFSRSEKFLNLMNSCVKPLDILSLCLCKLREMSSCKHSFQIITLRSIK